MSSITELFKEQERTTEEVKKLRMEFSNFFDAERSRSLGLLESMRENKGDDDPVITTGSKKTASENSKSGLKSMLEKATGSLIGKMAMGALATAVTAAVVAGVKVGFNDIKKELRDLFNLDDDPNAGGGGDNPMLDPQFQFEVFGRGLGNLASQGLRLYKPAASKGFFNAYSDIYKKNTIPEVKPKDYVTRVNGVVQPNVGTPEQKPSVVRTAAAAAGEVLGQNIKVMATKVAVRATPIAGTGVGLLAASEQLAKGNLSSAAIIALGSLPGVGTVTSLSIGSLDMIRETYKQQNGSYPSADAAIEMANNGGKIPVQTFEKLKVAVAAIGNALVPEIEPLGNRVAFSQSMSQAMEGAAKRDANRAAAMAAMDAKFTNGIPNDLMIPPNNSSALGNQPIVTTVNVQGGGSGGSPTPAGGINPPTESSGSMLDAQNSSLSLMNQLGRWSR